MLSLGIRNFVAVIKPIDSKCDKNDDQENYIWKCSGLNLKARSNGVSLSMYEEVLKKKMCNVERGIFIRQIKKVRTTSILQPYVTKFANYTIRSNVQFRRVINHSDTVYYSTAPYGRKK